MKLVLKSMPQSRAILWSADGNTADFISSTWLQLDTSVWDGESSMLLQFEAKMPGKQCSAPSQKRHAVYA